MSLYGGIVMKLTISKSKNSEHLYISKSIRNGDKVTTKTFLKLGSMADLLPKHNNSREEVLSWAKQQVAFYTAQDNADSLDIHLKLSSASRISLDSLDTFSSGYLFLQDIFYDLKLHQICDTISSRHRFDFNLTDILSRLVYSRILNPSSKLSTFEYSKSFVESPSFDSHQIYRALDVLAYESDFIQSSLYNFSTSVVSRDTSVLYYDCSNFFFEIEEAQGLKQYGKSKEHKPNPIVQMGLFMDGNGIPLSFVLFPGNQNEQPSLIPLEKKIIKDFNVSKFIVCTDAGLASTDNRKFNNTKNRSYIVTQSLKKQKKHLKEWSLDPTGWKLSTSDTLYNLYDIDEESMMHKIFYKERWIKENGLEQRFIVSYSPKYKIYQQSIRQSQIDRAKKLVASKQQGTRNPNSPSRFVVETKTTTTGEVAQESHYSIDEQAIMEESKYDGFYGICTTLEDDIEEILHINKQRWEIEESFRIMKTEFKTRPIYLQNDNRIEAHFLTCFIALLIYRILEKKLDEQYSSNKIIGTLREMKVKQYRGYGYIPVYQRTEITDHLHEVFGFQTDTEIISERNMKKIIRQTKK